MSRFLRQVVARVAAVSIGAALLALPLVAHTQGPVARVEAVAVPDSITRSTAALPTYASYRITLTSLVRDQLNGLAFQGTVAVQDSSDAAALFSVDGATCTLSAAGALACAVPGELVDNGQTVSFTITLKAPVSGSAIVLTGQALVNAHCCGSVQTNTASASTALTAPSPDAFSTFVPSAPTPTTLFSGTNTQGGVVGSIPIVDFHTNDPFTTTVIVPGGSVSTTASVAERELLQSCSANPRCFESKLAIPGSFDYLTIILRRDRTTLTSARHSGQSAIDNAIVKYFPDDDPSNPDKFIIVPNCTVMPGGVPTPKNPCIVSRKAYPTPKNGKPFVPAGLVGDWEFVIRALDNGRYVN